MDGKLLKAWGNSSKSSSGFVNLEEIKERMVKTKAKAETHRRSNEQHLLHKYTHVGCPALKFEDVCTHPAHCAQTGCCVNLNRGLSDEEVDGWLRHMQQE